MATTSDPYRMLGLDRGASLADVRKAYRRLAKVYHPDSAGEAALPRFLAIQAAYDQILGIDSSAGSPGRPGSTRRPWDADPERADATRRAYGGRRRSTGRAGRARSDPAGGPSADGRSGPDQSSRTGQDRTDGPTDARRQPNKATPGSTSYDGADLGPFEPDWGGASWYGTSSGTYWTLNPREYADPRKHGPEYQARARRAAAAAGSAATGPPPPGVGPTQDGTDPAMGSPDRPAGTDGPSPSTTTGSWWDATAGGLADGPVDTAPRGPEPIDPDPPSVAASDAAASPASSAAASSRAAAVSGAADPGAADPGAVDPGPRPWPVLEGAPSTIIERIGRAILGWIPIALAIGWGVGEASGCARFSSDCDPSAGPTTWLLQGLVLVVLIVAPALASVAGIGTIGALGASIPAAIALSGAGASQAVDGVGPAGAGPAVIAVAMGGWAVGCLVGTLRWVRRRQAPDARSGSSVREAASRD